MKTTLILRGKADHFNRLSVYIRHSDKQKRTLVQTDLLLTEEQFERFKKGLPGKKEADLYKKFLSLMDGQEISNQLKPVTTFAHYVASCIKEWKNEKAFETIRQITAEQTKLLKFAPSLLITGLTPTFLQKYKEYCYSIGNKQNTLWKSFKFLRMITRKAIREKLLEENPFDVFEMPKYKDPPRKYLTTDEIKQIEDLLEGTLPDEVRFSATWFLIGCYTGLRYGDMHAFNKKEHIVKGRIIIYTAKTGEPVSMPLSEKVKGLFESIKYKPLYYQNQTYNRMLKIIQELAGIKKPLTAHISRHTAAIRWADAGISQEVAGKLLGHQNLRTTQIYYKLSGKRIDEEMKRVDG